MAEINLKISYPPFTRSSDSIEKVMYTVAIALLPATAASIHYFGLRALYVTLVAVASCILFEWMSVKIRRKECTCMDGSALVTGMLIALNLPSNIPYWMVVTGAFVAIVVTKALFGGLGYNIFNPALVARVFLLISFPVAMTSWPQALGTIDMATTASPLGILKTEGLAALSTFDLKEAFFGGVSGSLGETSALALLLGAALLYYKKYITAAIPLTFIGSTLLFVGIFHLVDPTQYATPQFHLLTGGLLLGAFFMATDMVTSPLSMRGQIIFGIGCGLLTGIIRLFGGYPEGVSFAILIMNAFVPLIDKWDLSGKKFAREDTL